MFDFSEQSIISNFYYGIHNVHDAIASKCIHKIQESVNMLQVPVSLNENGLTAGVSNGYLVCCSYFYLCLVSKVQGDDMQVAVHFLQALMVAPWVVRCELAPELYRIVVESCIAPLGDGFQDGFEGVRRGAMRYKAWLMYYQVMCYGPSPLLTKHTSHEIR